MRLLWRIARPQMSLLIVALVLSIATAVLTVLQPQYLQRAVNGLVTGGATSSVLVLLGVLTVVTGVSGSGIDLGEGLGFVRGGGARQRCPDLRDAARRGVRGARPAPADGQQARASHRRVP